MRDKLTLVRSGVGNISFAAALMRVTFWCFLGFTGGTGFRRSGTGSGIYARSVDDRSVSMEGELLDLCCDSCQKMMLPNTQSIEGL